MKQLREQEESLLAMHQKASSRYDSNRIKQAIIREEISENSDEEVNHRRSPNSRNSSLSIREVKEILMSASPDKKTPKRRNE